jgi:MarR family transcriptional regulator, organic hydroperoxide resistance regulator
MPGSVYGVMSAKISIEMNMRTELQGANRISVEDWELLAQVAQAYRSLSDSFMEQIDMHRAQATLLCRLFARDGMTQSEIAEQLSVQGATVTNMLQRMEETGLVARRRDHEDNRLVRVYLTEKGRKQERAITEQFTKVEQAIFEGLDAEDRAMLRRMLRQILRNMNT